MSSISRANPRFLPSWGRQPFIVDGNAKIRFCKRFCKQFQIHEIEKILAEGWEGISLWFNHWMLNAMQSDCRFSLFNPTIFVLYRFLRLAGWIDAMLKEPAVRATYTEPSQLVKYYHTRGIGKPEFQGKLQPPQYDIWITPKQWIKGNLVSFICEAKSMSK